MNEYFKKIAGSSFFVPIIIIILIAIAVSSMIDNENKTQSQITTEKQLEEMCNAITGVGDAKVMITYETVEAVIAFENKKQNIIKGVAVVCEGGGNPDIQLKLYEMIKALFGLPSTRITVSERSGNILS